MQTRRLDLHNICGFRVEVPYELVARFSAMPRNSASNLSAS